MNRIVKSPLGFGLDVHPGDFDPPTAQSLLVSRSMDDTFDSFAIFFYSRANAGNADTPVTSITGLTLVPLAL
jgi:hypothetical protein